VLRQDERAARSRRGGEGYKFPIEEGDFHQETSDVSGSSVIHVEVAASDPQPSFSGRVPYHPLNGRQNMILHLDEGGDVVRLIAKIVQILDSGYALLGILELGCNPQSRTADELEVFDIHDAPRTVPVDDVECQVQGFGTKLEEEMRFDEKVDETGSHVPLDLGLLVHAVGRGHGGLLYGGCE
jgi:hypothetical protein